MSNDRKTPHKIKEIFVESSENLSFLYFHAQSIIRLQNNLKAELPTPLNKHVTIANYDSNTLIIQTDSSAWAARLRFKIPELLAILKFKCGLSEIKSIRIKIKVPDGGQSLPGRNPGLSDQASNFLINIANSISDPDLRQSLLKISKHN